MTPHTSNDCQKKKIDELSQEADNEYHIAMLSSEPKRKERAASRIRSILNQLEEIKKVVVCKDCLEEISVQMNLQSRGLEDIQSHDGSLLDI